MVYMCPRSNYWRPSPHGGIPWRWSLQERGPLGDPQVTGILFRQPMRGSCCAGSGLALLTFCSWSAWAAHPTHHLHGDLVSRGGPCWACTALFRPQMPKTVGDIKPFLTKLVHLRHFVMATNELTLNIQDIFPHRLFWVGENSKEQERNCQYLTLSVFIQYMYHLPTRNVNIPHHKLILIKFFSFSIFSRFNYLNSFSHSINSNMLQKQIQSLHC